MSDLKEWSQWQEYLSYLTSNPVKILEIGIGNGDSMKKIVKLFIANNNKSKYYGIDEWNTYGKKSNDIEKKAINNLLKLKEYKNNISYINKNPSNTLKKFLDQNKYFDFIKINSIAFEKKFLLYYSVLAIEILNIHGYILFDNYITFNDNSTKECIDSIVSIYKDKLQIVYIGNQILLQNLPKNNIEDTKIVFQFNNLFDKYWLFTLRKLFLVLYNLEKIPELNPSYSVYKEDNDNKENIENYKKLKLEDILYKYSTLDNIKSTILKNIKNVKMNKTKYKTYYRLINTSLNHYSIFNMVNKEYYYYDNYKNHKSLSIRQDIVKLINNRSQNSDYINLDVSSYQDGLEKAEKYSQKYFKFNGQSILEYKNFKNIYNNIIYQTLLLRSVLELEGIFIINIDFNFNFTDDYLILLNHLFQKVNIYLYSNKIGRITIKISCLKFLGIDKELYTKLCNILFYSQKNDLEILSLFNSNTLYFKNNNYLEKMNEFVKEINSYMKIHYDILSKYIDKIKNHQKQRTINDLINFFKNDVNYTLVDS